MGGHGRAAEAGRERERDRVERERMCTLLNDSRGWDGKGGGGGKGQREGCVPL